MGSEITTTRATDGMHVIPLGDRIIVRRVEADDTTASGIVLPTGAQEKPRVGDVLAVGTGKDGTRLAVRPGWRILYGQYAGTPFKHNDEELLVMRADEAMVAYDPTPDA